VCVLVLTLLGSSPADSPLLHTGPPKVQQGALTLISRSVQSPTSLTLLVQNLKFPTAKVSSTADRVRPPLPRTSSSSSSADHAVRCTQVMILIQLVLDGVPGSELKNDSINPLLDSRAIFSAAVRISKCASPLRFTTIQCDADELARPAGMVDLAVEREDGAIRTMLELLRSLNGRCWDTSSFVLRQLEGIGEKSYKILVSNGIKGFDDVRECEPDRLEVLLGRYVCSSRTPRPSLRLGRELTSARTPSSRAASRLTAASSSRRPRRSRSSRSPCRPSTRTSFQVARACRSTSASTCASRSPSRCRPSRRAR